MRTPLWRLSSFDLWVSSYPFIVKSLVVQSLILASHLLQVECVLCRKKKCRLQRIDSFVANYCTYEALICLYPYVRWTFENGFIIDERSRGLDTRWRVGSVGMLTNYEVRTQCFHDIEHTRTPEYPGEVEICFMELLKRVRHWHGLDDVASAMFRLVSFECTVTAVKPQ